MKTIFQKLRTEIWEFFFVFEVMMASVSTENMRFRLTFHIKLVLFKNIDILPIYGLKLTKFRVYAHICAYGFWHITL